MVATATFKYRVAKVVSLWKRSRTLTSQASRLQLHSRIGYRGGVTLHVPTTSMPPKTTMCKCIACSFFAVETRSGGRPRRFERPYPLSHGHLAAIMLSRRRRPKG